MKYLQKLLIFFALVFFVLSLWFVVRPRKTVELSKTVNISGKTLKVEIADSTVEREQGLSDRESLCPGCGLLFIFDHPGIYAFWMKRMHFNIDILWLKGDEIVDLTYGAKAPRKEEFDRPKTIYQSKVPVDKVLEVNAGWVEKNGIKIGDKVK